MKFIIISASRRTDIPAFYSRWFMNRIREGYCTVVNPYNRNQVSRVSLHPEDVDVIVFVTKNPKPMIPYLDELDSKGYRYYFQFTLTGYSPELEAYVPDLDSSIKTFVDLASRIGPGKVIWRYDPIIISNLTGYEYHKTMFQKIAEYLKGSTNRVIISIVTAYRKAALQFEQLAKQDIHISKDLNPVYFEDMIRTIYLTSSQNDMEIFSCAEKHDLRPFGILPGKCIDNEYIERLFGISVTQKRDKSQRLQCGCVDSKDIGFYDTCLHGCAYCYAGTYQGGLKNIEEHNPNSASLLGNFDVRKDDNKQISLFNGI
ncbi:MAG: DUF1848 domain-containing protein [Desulfitobacterium hafniense]|nr:DUF1848 domain-containing protein [Desulfitobacterium hafniense]